MRIIGGLYRGKKLLSPRSANIRPTADQAREAVFNILSSRLDKPWNELSMADVFTGSGAFADKKVGTNKAVTVSGYSLSGADAENYTLTQPSYMSADITAKGISLTGIAANDKV